MLLISFNDKNTIFLQWLLWTCELVRDTNRINQLVSLSCTFIVKMLNQFLLHKLREDIMESEWVSEDTHKLLGRAFAWSWRWCWTSNSKWLNPSRSFASVHVFFNRGSNEVYTNGTRKSHKERVIMCEVLGLTQFSNGPNQKICFLVIASGPITNQAQQLQI